MNQELAIAVCDLAGDDTSQSARPRYQTAAWRPCSPCAELARPLLYSTIMPAPTITHSLGLDTPERRRCLARLSDAAYKAKRLAALRRALFGILVPVGAPVIIFARATNPTLRHLVFALSVAWVATLVPMIRVLHGERRSRLLIEELQATLYGGQLLTAENSVPRKAA